MIKYFVIMLKNKQYLFFLFCILLIFITNFIFVKKVFAKISIVEVMYDAKGTDTDKEWVKIINDNESDIDISKIKLTINDSNHLIKDLDGSTTISKGDSVVLVDNPINFKINFPNYHGKVFDSSFTLTNASGTVAIKDDKNVIIDSMSYDSSMGASGDGNSLQKIGGIWETAAATIGFIEEQISTSTDNTNNQNNTSSSTISTSTNTQTTKIVTRTVYVSAHSGIEDLSNYTEKTIFQMSAGRERMALVGSPLEFDAKYSVPSTNQCTPNFSWSFGDGFEVGGKNITHTYKYAGEYQVVLNGTCGEESSVSRTIVKVINPEISIVQILGGDIEIKNNGKTEINIGGWKIRGIEKDFIFPKDTIISANNKIILSKDDLNISSSTERVALANPSGREVAYFNLSSREQENSVLSSVATTTQAETLSDSPSISVAEAEVLAEQYKKQIAVSQTPQKTTTITNDTKNLSTNDNLQETATVAEAVTSSSTKSFWTKLIDIPINGMKAFAHIFYNF